MKNWGSSGLGQRLKKMEYLLILWNIEMIANKRMQSDQQTATRFADR
jgi:hypothetical protein